MRLVRLFISEPGGTSESVRYRLPVRIGRHPRNDWRMEHPAVSRFHLELDWVNDGLLLRVLGSRTGVLVRIAGEMRRLCGCELTMASREVEFAIAGIWVKALVEERDASQAAARVQAAVDGLLETCTRVAECDDAPLEVLSELGRGLVAVRGVLRSDESLTPSGRDDAWEEVVAALLRWTQASMAAISYVESVLQLEPREEA